MITLIRAQLVVLQSTARSSQVEALKETHANAGERLEVTVIEDISTGDYSEALQGN